MGFKFTKSETAEQIGGAVESFNVIVTDEGKPDLAVGVVCKMANMDWRYPGQPDPEKKHRTRAAAAGALFDAYLAGTIEQAKAKVTKRAKVDPATYADLPNPLEQPVPLEVANPPGASPVAPQPPVDPDTIPDGPLHAPSEQEETEPDAFAEYEPEAPADLDDFADYLGAFGDLPDDVQAQVLVDTSDALAMQAASYVDTALAQAPQISPDPSSIGTAMHEAVIAMGVDPAEHGESTAIIVRVVGGVITVDCSSCADTLVGTRNLGLTMDTLKEHVGRLLADQREAVKEAHRNSPRWP